MRAIFFSLLFVAISTEALSQILTTSKPGSKPKSTNDQSDTRFALSLESNDDFTFVPAQSYTDKIKAIKKAYDKAKDKIDSLYTVVLLSDGTEAAETRRKNDLDILEKKTAKHYALTFEKYSNDQNILFPVRGKRSLVRYYYSGRSDKSVEALRNNYFSINAEIGAGSVYSELIAGYLGGFRISFGGMISKSELREISSDEANSISNLDSLVTVINSENEQKLASQNILAGGGNALINLSSPVFYYQSFTRDWIGSLTFFERVGFLLPEIGTQSDDIQATNSLGLVLDNWIDLDFGGENDFAFVVRGTLMNYSNKRSINELGIDKSSLWFGELSLGFEIASQFRLSVNLPTILDDIEGENPFSTTISLNIIPFK